MAAYKNFVQRYIYIFKLEDDCWYVGSTGNYESALERAKNGQGGMWLQEHSFKSVHKVIDIEPTDDTTEQRTEITIQLMMEHGVHKVRGGIYSNPEFPDWVEDKLYEQLNKHIDKNKMIKW